MFLEPPFNEGQTHITTVLRNNTENIERERKKQQNEQKERSLAVSWEKKRKERKNKRCS